MERNSLVPIFQFLFQILFLNLSEDTGAAFSQKRYRAVLLLLKLYDAADKPLEHRLVPAVWGFIKFRRDTFIAGRGRGDKRGSQDAVEIKLWEMIRDPLYHAPQEAKQFVVAMHRTAKSRILQRVLEGKQFMLRAQSD